MGFWAIVVRGELEGGETSDGPFSYDISRVKLKVE